MSPEVHNRGARNITFTDHLWVECLTLDTLISSAHAVFSTKSSPSMLISYVRAPILCARSPFAQFLENPLRRRVAIYTSHAPEMSTSISMVAIFFYSFK